MLFVRRLLLGLAIAALLCAAAVVTGDALHDGPTGRPAAVGTAGPEAAVAASTTYPPARARVPRIEAGPTLLGPGDRGRPVRDLQARLRQIDWFQSDVTGFYGRLTTTAVRGFQAKRGIPVTGVVDRRTLARLHAMTAKPTRAELHNRANAPGALDPRCRVGRVLCIDKTSSTLRWVVDGRVRQTLDARFGAAATPTREGVFHVYLKSADHVSRLYGSAMPFAMFFSGGQAVHYSSDFAAVGYAGASHGCVNIRDYDGIERLFGQVRLGDAVVVYWS
ncbi:L,D-transpeptidase family protein [Nocardioides sp. LMS-CY]|uniref:L,D-transpeptidase family protein n=1 Tax=Nocardioides sp. (strain LMS-CY) TaxID=2840457 RepID=UPI001C0013D4|nr:L,D-transpeptidase family protein [Nocardioides sp. LMS-CY]QWF22925.1 L,D-transpeptidase family protein [Nocardioides sp. LMS-CY]